MSLNMFKDDDEPLFPSAEKSNSGSEQDGKQLSSEEINNWQENYRKNKVLAFCFKSSKWILFFAAFLILVDLYAQTNKLESALIKECLSLVTYSVTSALGFMFGSNSK